MMTFVFATLSHFTTPRSGSRKPAPSALKTTTFKRRTVETTSARRRKVETPQPAAVVLQEAEKKREGGLWEFLRGRPRASWIGLIYERLDRVSQQLEFAELDLATAPEKYLNEPAPKGKGTRRRYLYQRIARLKSERFELRSRLIELRREAKHTQTAAFDGKQYGPGFYTPVVMNGVCQYADAELAGMITGAGPVRRKATEHEVRLSRKAAKRRAKEQGRAPVLNGGCGNSPVNGTSFAALLGKVVTVDVGPVNESETEGDHPFQIFSVSGRVPTKGGDKLAGGRRLHAQATRSVRLGKAAFFRVGVDRFIRSKHHRRGKPMSPKLDGVAMVAWCCRTADELEAAERVAHKALEDRYGCVLPVVEEAAEPGFEEWAHLYPYTRFADTETYQLEMLEARYALTEADFLAVSRPATSKCGNE